MNVFCLKTSTEKLNDAGSKESKVLDAAPKNKCVQTERLKGHRWYQRNFRHKILKIMQISTCLPGA